MHSALLIICFFARTNTALTCFAAVIAAPLGHPQGPGCLYRVYGRITEAVRRSPTLTYVLPAACGVEFRIARIRSTTPGSDR